METTWRIYKANIGACLAGSVLLTVAIGVTVALLHIGAVKCAEIVQQNQWQSKSLGIAFAITYITIFCSTLIFFSLGLIEFLMQIAKGREADFSRLVGAADLLFSGQVMFVIVLLSVFVGALLLVLPGIFAAVLFALAPIALIDRQEGAIAALATSAKLVSANLLTIAMLILSVGLSGSLVSVLTCGVGPLVTWPFQTLLLIVIYMRATGKRIAGD